MQTGNPGGPGEGRELYDHSFRFGDCPQLHAAAYGRDCGAAGLLQQEWEPYGRDKAKVELSVLRRLENRPNGRLILVTAMTPTPAGEGKTTTSIGLTDGLRRRGLRAMAALREPSLGPVSA